MKLLLILLLIPSLSFGAFTEFYCNASTGSNVNSGSDAGTSVYTSTNGNWNSGTGVFTPTDGSNPATASPGVTVGQFASVYNDGATVGVFIGRVTAVTNATNGTITVSTTAKAGTAPTTNATARTIKVGGAFKGPNANSSFPLDLSAFTNATNSTGNKPRVNMNNAASYSVTSGVSATGIASCVIQGYASSVGDGGKATIDAGTTAGISVFAGAAGYTLADMIIKNNASSSNDIGISDSSIAGATYARVVVTGMRGAGFVIGNSTAYECEAYANGRANSSTAGQRSGFASSGSGTAKLIRCYSHDNTGSNIYGFECSSGNSVDYRNCIADSNGNDGFNLLINGASGNNMTVSNCDSYGNGGDGIGIDFNSGVAGHVLIENCNLIKNTGFGINDSTSAGKVVTGEVYNSGYGSGTQVNVAGDSTLGALIESGKITYASGVTPYSSPTTGNFSDILAAAQGVGRGSFTQTDGTNTGTIGFPDIGAAQANIGAPFPTPTPVPTATATPTATPTPTPVIETSYGYPG